MLWGFPDPAFRVVNPGKTLTESWKHPKAPSIPPTAAMPHQVGTAQAGKGLTPAHSQRQRPLSPALGTEPGPVALRLPFFSRPQECLPC